MLKIEGFDKAQRELKRVQKALGEIEGELGSFSFDPYDPASIDLAITSMKKMLDEKLASFERSDFVMSLAEDMKEQYRALILKKAAEARIMGNK